MFTILLNNILNYVIDLADKIAHVTMKITITPKYGDEKRHFHTNRLLLLLLHKTLLQEIHLT